MGSWHTIRVVAYLAHLRELGSSLGLDFGQPSHHDNNL